MIASISSEILQTNIQVPSQRSLRVGTGRASAHHGELLQGMFPEDGELNRGLLTLPMPRMESIVTFWPDRSREIRTRPEGRDKAAAAARLCLDTLGYPCDGGCITIESNIPVGHGYGSSTADVIASIRAVAAATRSEFRESTICRLAVAAETASDAVIFGAQAVLFAQREAVSLNISRASIHHSMSLDFHLHAMVGSIRWHFRRLTMTKMKSRHSAFFERRRAVQSAHRMQISWGRSPPQAPGSISVIFLKTIWMKLSQFPRKRVDAGCRSPIAAV